MGCGKTALLTAILGEMHSSGSAPSVAGSIAYTAQAQIFFGSCFFFCVWVMDADDQFACWTMGHRLQCVGSVLAWSPTCMASCQAQMCSSCTPVGWVGCVTALEFAGRGVRTFFSSPVAAASPQHCQGGGRPTTEHELRCVQDPFIQNATLRDNILMGRPFREAAYEATLDACALRPDLAVLEGGDL